MRTLFFVILLVIGATAFGQRRSVIIDSSWYIGTWELKGIADIHGTLTTRKFRPEMMRFTNDSVFIKVDSGLYVGTWNTGRGRFKISIPSTAQFDYYWLSGTEDAIWFQTKGQKFQKYFVRTSRE